MVMNAISGELLVVNLVQSVDGNIYLKVAALIKSHGKELNNIYILFTH